MKMEKKKFKVVVTKTTEFEVEFDTAVWSQENIDKWKTVFYEADDLEDVARIFGPMYVDRGEGVLIEGYGIPLKDGEIPFPQCCIAEGINKVQGDIDVIGLTEDYATDVEEVTE